MPTISNDTWNSVNCDFSKNGYSLPTEAEWEYVARGGNRGIPSTQTSYSGSDTREDVAWLSGNGDGKMHEVKKKQENTVGIYDMTGKVWEYCWDWSGTIEADTAATGATSGTERVHRGAGYSDNVNNDNPDSCTVNSRSSFSPNSSYETLGFRVVRTAH